VPLLGTQTQLPGIPAVEELHAVRVGLPTGGQLPHEWPQASVSQLSVPHMLGQVQVLAGAFKVDPTVSLKQQFLL
jgi:hypothetical protein